MKKQRIIFALLLAVITVIGVTGTDIANIFFDSSGLEDTVIERSSVKNSAVYIASPNEISFNPMEIINDSDTDYDSSNWTNQAAFDNSKQVCADMVKALSSYDEKAKYSASDEDMASAIKFSDNKYFYLSKFGYYNPAGELRYVDFIITAFNYSIVYINFYSDTEYDLKSDEINNSLKSFQKNSESFFGSADINKMVEDFSGLQNVVSESEYGMDTGCEISELNLAYEYMYDYFMNSDLCDTSNPVKYFWQYSMALYFVDFYDDAYNTLYFDGSDYIETETSEYDNERYITSAYSTVYIYELFDNSVNFSSQQDWLTDSTEYIAYNGRIYQTTKFDNNNYDLTTSLVIIYNIEEDIVEGFYAKPAV